MAGRSGDLVGGVSERCCECPVDLTQPRDAPEGSYFSCMSGHVLGSEARLDDKCLSTPFTHLTNGSCVVRASKSRDYALQGG